MLKNRKKMKPVDVFTEITIAQPIDVVANYVANPDNAPEWYINASALKTNTPTPKPQNPQTTHNYTVLPTTSAQRL